MMESYRKLGMQLPELFYTDKVIADQGFLGEAIPSLLKDVCPIAPSSRSSTKEQNDIYGSLDPISLPSEMSVHIVSTLVEINSACQHLLDEEKRLGKLHVGFDCEWKEPRAVSLIQISTDSSVFLFRVHKFSEEIFPTLLSVVLTSKTVVKIGRNIAGDFTRITRGFNLVCEGQIDLGVYCRSKDVTQVTNMKLTHLCGHILKKRLPKPLDVIRSGWEATTLSAEQIQYAAIDGWVSLRIFREVEAMPAVNQRVSGKTACGAFVAVFTTSSLREIPSAYGFLCNIEDLSLEELDRSKVTTVPRNASLVRIIDVTVSGMLVDGDSFDSYGEVPFAVALNNTILKTASETEY